MLCIYILYTYAPHLFLMHTVHIHIAIIYFLRLYPIFFYSTYICCLPKCPIINNYDLHDRKQNGRIIISYFWRWFSNHDALKFRGDTLHHSSVLESLLECRSNQFLLHLYKFFLPPKITQRSDDQSSESFRFSVFIERFDHVISFILGNRRRNLQNARSILLSLDLNDKTKIINLINLTTIVIDLRRKALEIEEK